MPSDSEGTPHPENDTSSPYGELGDDVASEWQELADSTEPKNGESEPKEEKAAEVAEDVGETAVEGAGIDTEHGGEPEKQPDRTEAEQASNEGPELQRARDKAVEYFNKKAKAAHDRGKDTLVAQYEALTSQVNSGEFFEPVAYLGKDASGSLAKRTGSPYEFFQLQKQGLERALEKEETESGKAPLAEEIKQVEEALDAIEEAGATNAIYSRLQRHYDSAQRIVSEPLIAPEADKESAQAVVERLEPVVETLKRRRSEYMPTSDDSAESAGERNKVKMETKDSDVESNAPEAEQESTKEGEPQFSQGDSVEFFNRYTKKRETGKIEKVLKGKNGWKYVVKGSSGVSDVAYENQLKTSSAERGNEPEAKREEKGTEWAEVNKLDKPLLATWHGPDNDLRVTVIEIMRSTDGREFVKVEESPMPLPIDEIEYHAEDGGDKKREWNLHEAGQFNDEGVYELLVDLDELAESLDIPREIIEQAAEHGVTPERLLQARGNPYTAEGLRKLGIEWGAEMPEEEEEETAGSDSDTGLKDPILELAEMSVIKDREVGKYADLLASNPRRLRSMLKRPGELPLKLHRVPLVGRKIGRLLLARRIYETEKSARDAEVLKKKLEKKLAASNPALSGEEMEEKVNEELRRRLDRGEGKGLGRNHEDGMWGFGIPRTKHILEYVRKHDEDIIVQNNKLRRFNNTEYQGEEASQKSKRRDFAERFYRLLKDQEALDNNKIHSDDVVDYAVFQKRVSDYRKRHGRGGEAESS